MWTPTTGAQHSRIGLRYGSDLTDGEWHLLFPFLPPPSGCGRHCKWEMREVVNAIFDGGYAGPRVANTSPIHIQVVRRADGQVGFAVIARRWAQQPKVPRAQRVERLRRGWSASSHGSTETGAWRKTSMHP
jgi:transposase